MFEYSQHALCFDPKNKLSHDYPCGQEEQKNLDILEFFIKLTEEGVSDDIRG
jgi:hypothetical protein